MTDFPVNIAIRADALCQQLTERRMRLVIAESCTGGLLAASLSRSLGSSHCLVGSFVTYRPSLKITALAVPKGLIAERTVYDPQVCSLMATGALNAAEEADFALAMTGVAGPESDQGKPAGLVYIATALRGEKPSVSKYHFNAKSSTVVDDVIRTALDMGIAVIKSL